MSSKDAMSSPHLILGIDPGLHGALAFYDTTAKSLDSVFDMPLKDSSDGKKEEIDLHALSAIVDARSKEVIFAVIEEVGARPGQGVVSMFRFGFAAGAASAATASNYIPIQYVKPAVWKILMGAQADKRSSLKRARELFPTHLKSFERMRDDGRAEAALLAFFGQRLLLKYENQNKETT